MSPIQFALYSGGALADVSVGAGDLGVQHVDAVVQRMHALLGLALEFSKLLLRSHNLRVTVRHLGSAQEKGGAGRAEQARRWRGSERRKRHDGCQLCK